MADLAKYQQEITRFNTSYAKEAVKEPFNFWGLAGFAVAAAYTGSVIPLLDRLDLRGRLYDCRFRICRPIASSFKRAKKTVCVR